MSMIRFRIIEWEYPCKVLLVSTLHITLEDAVKIFSWINPLTPEHTQTLSNRRNLKRSPSLPKSTVFTKLVLLIYISTLWSNNSLLSCSAILITPCAYIHIMRKYNEHLIIITLTADQKLKEKEKSNAHIKYS